MTIAIPMEVIKTKKQCFQLFFGRTHALVLRICFASPIAKIGRYEINLCRPDIRICCYSNLMLFEFEFYL